MAASRLHPLENPGPQRAVAPKIGKYDVETEIGHGDLVRVFRAYDRDLSRPVILKVLTGLNDSALTRRFRAEVACVAKLRNAGIIGIYELGEHVGLPFAAMQVLDDHSLEEALQGDRSLTLLEKALAVANLADGLRAAHLAGLPCVGLRPSGIALDSGARAIIRDFGIVRLHPEDEEEAARYAAPELFSGESAPDSLCDLYALGVIAHELLAGTRPSLSVGAVGETVPLRELAPECPEDLERVVNRALEKSRELRYQTADDLLDEIEPILRELRRNRSVTLLEEAHKLFEAQDLEQANSVLREILDLDPDNRKAQRLRADVRGLLNQRTIRPRIEAFLRHADQELSSGDYKRAIEHLEAAQRLDQNDAGITSRLETARARWEQNRRSAELVAEAKLLLDRQAFEDARAVAAEALDIDPQNGEARELVGRACEAIVQRDRQAKIDEGLARAKSLLLLQQFDEAARILTGLQRECPDSADIAHWLDHVRRQEAEALRLERLNAQLEHSRTLLLEQRLDDAILTLTSLDLEFPDEPEIHELLAEARHAKQRTESLRHTEDLCRQYRREEQFEKAIQVLDTALTEWPDEPVLQDLHRQVERELRDRICGAATRQALQETQWLIEQDRPDLAAGFLREKAAEFPDAPELSSRLAEIERILGDWEKRRFVQDALHRVEALVELQQWPVALTLVEEALESYPDATELLASAEQLRGRLSEEERRKRLARRLDAINQQVSAQAWPQAFQLIEAAEAEFPGAPQLLLIRHTTEQRRSRSESENMVREIRQCMADGEPERAEELLRIGMECLPADAGLQSLQEELEAGKRYRDEWRSAQVLFGRRQFQEAEAILMRLAQPDRPEVNLLLEKVRQARAASEEDHFYKDGREKALKLVQQHEPGQAADLLRNLLALFPGDPILERDLQTIQAGLAASAPVAAPVQHEPEVPQPAPLVPPPIPANPIAAAEPAPPPKAQPARALELAPPPFSRPVTSGTPRSRWAIIGVGVVLFGSGALWKFTRHADPVAAARKPADASPAVQPTVQAPISTPNPGLPASVAVGDLRPDQSLPSPSQGVSASRAEPKPAAGPLRPFTAPGLPSAGSSAQVEAIPPAPGAAPATQGSAALPQLLDRAAVSAPPPGPAPAPAETAVNPTQPQQRITSRLEEPKLVKSLKPVAPPFARQSKLHGVVNLEASVGKDGLVREVKVLSGHPVLGQAARDAVMRWRYQPATLNGQAVEAKVEVKITFE